MDLCSKRILVTGANGFVGKCLINVLKKQGVYVVGTGRKLVNSKADSFFSIPDFCDLNAWKQPLLGCNTVVHLASRVHVMHDTLENPLEAFLAINLHGTVNLAESAAKAGVSRFVFVSTVKVNGELTRNKKFTENDKPNPQNPYAISKWEAEKALRKIEQETGMEVVILRPPLIYGARVKANFFSLLKLVDRAIPLPLANIDNKRSLIYLENFVDAILVCATHSGAAGQTYLVSDGEGLSMGMLIKKIAFSLNRPSYVFPFPVSVMRFFARLVGKTTSLDRLTQSLEIDCSKIHSELGWQPPFAIEQGLKITAEWYRKVSNQRI